MLCEYLNNMTGKACKSQAITGSKYCLWHDPEKKEEARKARQEGAKQSNLKRATLEIGRLSTCRDLARYHRSLIKKYAAGEIADKKFQILSDSIAKQNILLENVYIETDRKRHNYPVGITSISENVSKEQAENEDNDYPA